MGAQRAESADRVGRGKKSAERLARELELAIRLGVAPRRLWGWEARKFTEYHYDADGRISGTVTYTEPEFTDRERNMLLAHMALEVDRGPHGQPMSEATDPQGSPSTWGGWHYEADVVDDYAELAIATRRDAYFKQYGDRMTEAQKAAKQFRVRKVLDS